MTMAKYVRGPRWSVDYTPGSSVNAGDVISVGNITLISDTDNPVGSGLSIIQMSVYIGGIYEVAADAAYPVGTKVSWNPTSQEVTTVADASTILPFGEIVAGPLGLASDGGPTGAGSPCYVLHDPERLIEGPNLQTQIGGTAFAAALSTIRTEGNLYAKAGNPVAGNTADTNDDILFGIQLPIGAFDVAARQLTIVAQGETGATTNNKRFKIFVNPTMTGDTVNADGSITGGHVTAGTPICDSGAWVNGTTPNSNVGWWAQAVITKYGASGSNTQMGQGQAITGTLHGGVQAGQALTLAENAVINIVVTGSSYTTGAANDVNLQQFTASFSN